MGMMTPLERERCALIEIYIQENRGSLQKMQDGLKTFTTPGEVTGGRGGKVSRAFLEWGAARYAEEILRHGEV